MALAPLLVLALACPSRAFAVTPADLRQRIEGGEKITLIDVRSTEYFQKGHIPGAINVPAALCAAKKLPPLGTVVVYDAGLARESADAAAAALGRKPGLRVEVLEGGLAAWEMFKGGTTQSSGVQPEQLPMITYEKLKEVQTEDTVLVDLRNPEEPVAGRTKSAVLGPPLPMTDLGAEFPKARIVKSPFNVAPTKKSGDGAGTPPLLVLIDNGDGTAQQMARALKANGNTRFVILAGGESILERQGRPGLQRKGSSLSAPVLTTPLPQPHSPTP